MNQPLCCRLVWASSLAFALAVQAETSALWGTNGESWTPQSRLPDFSWAGYRSGGVPPRDVPSSVNVKSFGARGDGETDDTAAFKAALAAGPGVIELPPGRYRLTDMLEIDRSNVVLRGAGTDKTVLFFPRPLQEIRPQRGATTQGRVTSSYSWGGGFITFRGRIRDERLARVTAEATRGDTVLRVSTTNGLRVGQRINISQQDDSTNSLADELYSGDAGDKQSLRDWVTTSLVCRIVKIEGDRIHFDRPLRCQVRLEWNPQIKRFEPTVTESGIENVSFEFPATPYLGHFTEVGFNALAFTDVADCWARNIRIVNPDNGAIVRARFCTLEDFVFESSRAADTNNCTGHHGVYFYGDDNFLAGFDYRMRFLHDITVSHSAGNVFANGKGLDLTFDHHRRAPHENLFCNIDAGAGTRLWRSGGGRGLGKHCGARGTFWNIRATLPLSYPPATFGPPSLNLVALFTKQPSETNLNGRWFEAIPPGKIEPQDIHEAQLAKRLKSK